MNPSPRPADLREACIEESFRIIAEVGLEGLSLRDVARRLGVSHQAPYKHFPSRDHLLAELIARSFDDFAQYLENRPLAPDPGADFRAMGALYLEYARKFPLKYRLIFGTKFPDPSVHPHMLEKAEYAFSLLRDRLQIILSPDGAMIPPVPKLDALFVWSVLHGLVSLLNSDIVGKLGLTPADLGAAVPQVLTRVGIGLELIRKDRRPPG